MYQRTAKQRFKSSVSAPLAVLLVAASAFALPHCSPFLQSAHAATRPPASDRSINLDMTVGAQAASNKHEPADALSAQNPSSRVDLTIRDVGPETGYSGSGSGFTFNRHTRQVILPSPQRVFRSLNGGARWSPLDLAVSPGSWGTPQTAGSFFVRQDPRDPEVLYAVTAGSGNLARSTDFGATWTQLGVDYSFGQSLANFADIAVHEALPNVVLALKMESTEFGPALWRSEDGGAAFTPQWNSGLPRDTVDPDTGEGCSPNYSNIATTPADPNVVYVVQSQGSDILEGNFSCPAGVHKSTDGGLTFAPLEAASEVVAETPGRTFGAPIQVFPHPTRPEVLFVQTDYPLNTSIYRSMDGGASFQPVRGGLTNENYFVSFDPHDPSLVYVAGRRGVFRSRDDGETFQPLGLTAEQLGPLATNVNVDPSHSKVIYVNTWHGNFKSANGGVTFHAINTGWRAAFIRTIAFDNRANPTLYLATDHGIMRTSTRGHHYEHVPGPGALNNTRLLTIAPSNPDMIVAVTRRSVFEDAALYRTLDGGHSWIESSVDTGPVLPNAIVVDPQDFKNVYFVGEGGFYRSVDAGATFERVVAVQPSGREAYFAALAIDPHHANVIFAGGETSDRSSCLDGCGTLFRSVDGGLSFAPTTSLTDQFDRVGISQVLIDPQNPNTIVALGLFSQYDPLRQHNIVRSTDGGATWSPAGTGVPPGCKELVMNAEDPARLYCLTEAPVGLAMTSDSGSGWSVVSADEIAKLGIAELLINPKRPNRLYVLGNALLEVEIHDE